MSNRAQKSGFAAEAQEAVNSKFDKGHTEEALGWVKRITGEPISTEGTMDNVFDTLGDGYVLCCLMKKLGSNIKFKRETMPFKKMENINKFLVEAEKYGVNKTELFQTVDLYDRTNLTQVVMTIHALGRKVKAKGGDGIGPKESERQSREWTEEQLKAGQNVIGLQMGSNKGATQAGQNFGKGRMIVD